MSFWNKADAALNKLADTMPGFEPTTTLLKVVAVNQLYGANLYAYHRMAVHICAVLRTGYQQSPQLVERIACLPVAAGQAPRHHVSFASKFCPLTKRRSPIFDSYAEWTVRFYLGRGRVQSAKHRYLAFVQNAQQLASAPNQEARPGRQG